MVSCLIEVSKFKNKFENNLKRKTQNLSLPSPLSPLRPTSPGLLFFFSYSARKPAQAAGLLFPTAHAQAGPPGLACLPADPSRASPTFLLCPVTGRWGPAVRPFPYLQPRGGRAPIMAASRFWPGLALPRFQTRGIKCSEVPPSFPLINRPLPRSLLNLSPLNFNQGRGH
jgi:hypothetical protein